MKGCQQRRRRAVGLSPLSRRINAAYARCERRGGHELSDRVITRDYYGNDREFVICAVCTVPLPSSRAIGWMGQIVDVLRGAA